MSHSQLRRAKVLTLIAGIAVGGLTLLAWTMPWFVVTLVNASTQGGQLEVTGEHAAPALAALGLAGLALVGALAIAGPVFRVVLGVLEAAIGISVCLSAWGAITDPIAAAAPLVSEHTGISGSQSVSGLIESATPTPWPVATVLIGALSIVLGALIVVTAGRWPSRPSRYQAVRLEDAQEPRSAVSDWDSLSDGDDPTSR
jgi:uncharacterized membrane protein (TIGR02234 family)